MRNLSSRLAWIAALSLVACNMNVVVNPEGLVCDPGGVCPNGFVCRNGTCSSTGGSGGGSGGGAGGSGGGVATCNGVLCNQPKPPECHNANTLRTFASSGTCTNGKCDYLSTDKTCANGCANGLCVGDLCNGVSCTTPPVPACTNPTTLTTFSSTGTCTNGTCSYTATNTACVNGCSIGMCLNQNLCAGVVCTSPPAPTCVGANSRAFMSPGACAAGTGVCSYNPIDTVCASGCAGGLCLTAGQTFTQTMPRVPFAVNGIDQAPNSTGGHVVVVGDKGNIMKWDGTAFTRVTSVAPTVANLNSVWFAGASSALIVGSSRTLARYNGTSYAVVPSLPVGNGGGNLMYVHGKDESNFTLADESSAWWRFVGPSTWTSGSYGIAAGVSYKNRGVFVDGLNRARIVGQKTSGTPAANIGVVHYFENSICVPNPCEDVDTTGVADGFGAVGPAISGGATSVNSAFLGRLTTNGPRRHNDANPFYDSTFTPSLVLPSGTGITGITGTSGATRAVYFLENSSTVGHLYRYGAIGVDPGNLGEFYWDKVTMGANESGGVVVAEADLTNGVNNIYRRNPIFGEMLDLGESWVSASSTGTTLVVVSGFGDVAYRVGAGPTWQFRRGPFMTVLDATAANGTGALLVGTGGTTERFVAGTLNPTVTSITGGTSDLAAVCRVSDLEAYAVGKGGVIRSISTTLATSTPMTSPANKDLLAVDCPTLGTAVACGQGATLLKLTGTNWAAVSPALPASVGDLTSCRLAGTSIWVAGDNTFYKLDLSAPSPAWQQLASAPKLSGLQVIGPNEVYAISAGAKVLRFDGSSWNPRFAVSSGTLVGGGQVGGKVVYAGSLGVVVEGQ